MEDAGTERRAPEPFRLGGVVWTLMLLGALGPLVLDIVLLMRADGPSPEAMGEIIGRGMGRVLVWLVLVSLASVLLWRVTGRRRAGAYAGSAIMLLFLTCAGLGNLGRNADAGRELLAVQAAGEQHRSAVLRSLAEGREPPSDAAHLIAQAERLERAAASRADARRTFAALASYFRQYAEVFGAFEAAAAAIPEDALDCARTGDAELELRIEAVRGYLSAASAATDFEVRAAALLRTEFSAAGESPDTASAVVRGMERAGGAPGSNRELFAAHQAAAAAQLRSLEFLRDYQDESGAAGTVRIARACSTPDYGALQQEESAAAEQCGQLTEERLANAPVE